MLFNSLTYILFLISVLIIYFNVPKKFKNFVLLISSLLFYMCWNKIYVLLMIFSITTTFISGILIENETKKNKRKFWVFISFFINLFILFYFKYYNFILEILENIFVLFTNKTFSFTKSNVLLPVGISFYTFQALGYTVDVYRKDLPAQKNFFKYALFVSFFPQLVAGPIERAKNIISQLEKTYNFSFINLRHGFIKILWGMFKKIIIADRLAIIVNTVYNNIFEYEGVAIFVATVAFAFQIYCDFSAYSDIAIGSAKIIGIDLMKNFDAPYFSKSISEFWSRWHISLSTWFRDYLYIPMGGNRKGRVRKYINIMIVFFISGLWHGAGMTFIFWGILNGLYQIASDLTKNLRRKILKILNIDETSFSHKFLKIFTTFILTCISWIFFRANTFNEAIYASKFIFYPNYWTINDGSLLLLGLDLPEIIISIISIVILFVIDNNLRKNLNVIENIIKQPSIYRFFIYAIIIMCLLIFGVYGGNYESVNFLYFQF